MTLSDRARRWGGTVLLALLVCAGCVTAGVWQWHRHEQRSAAVARVEANYDAEPVPLDRVLDGVPPADREPIADGASPAGGAPLDRAAEWRPVTVTGSWTGPPVLLRNRPTDGRPAFHVLGVLTVAEGPLTGERLVVDRGWLPVGRDGSAPDAVPALPAGEVDVVVRVRAPEPASDRDAPPGQVHAVAPAQVAAAAGLGGEPLPLYGVLVTEQGVPAAGVGAIPPPDTDLGSHLSYTFQWWLFAVGSLVGAGLLIRRDLAAEQEDAREPDAAAEPDAAGQPEAAAGGDGRRAAAPAGAPTTVPPAPAGTARGPGGRTGPARRRRRPSAEEEEDAILDRQTAQR